MPQDYKKTLSKINEGQEIPEYMLNLLAALPNADLINKVIITVIMTMTIKSDVDALKFCDILENLVDTQSSLVHIRNVRNGKVCCMFYKCMCSSCDMEFCMNPRPLIIFITRGVLICNHWSINECQLIANI